MRILALLMIAVVLTLTACSTAAGTTEDSPPPEETEGAWRGLTIAPENRCSPYNRDDYDYPQSVEELIAARDGLVSPYDGTRFTNLAESDIDHVVALSEAHDSGLCAASAETRRGFARDLDNLALATPELNQNQKQGLDAGEWVPPLNRCWFAETVVKVRLKYDLTIDLREVEAVKAMLADCPDTGPESPAEPAPEDDPAPPPVKQYRVCADMRAAGWTRGVNRDGGTYRDSWDAAERETYSLNQSRDRDRDGHACE